MDKTKIEWCDATWNPVAGCLHGCPYCYARNIAERFAGCDKDTTYGAHHQATWRRANPDSKPDAALFEVDAACPPVNIRQGKRDHMLHSSTAPYPWGFQPTLRRDHLDDYALKSQRTVFVCSMADLFGEWVPEVWIREVFDACDRAPQHRYLFLTKNPARISRMAAGGTLPVRKDWWFGTTVTRKGDPYFPGRPAVDNTFLSIEPLSGNLGAEPGGFGQVKWIIVGAETGRRKDKMVPKREWVEDIEEAALSTGARLFYKDSLLPVVGEGGMHRELPWETNPDKTGAKKESEMEMAAPGKRAAREGGFHG